MTHPMFDLSGKVAVVSGAAQGMGQATAIATAEAGADVVVVELDRGGIMGRGESVPYPRYDESVPGTLAELAAIKPQIEAGLDRQQLQDLLPPGAARNALDCALWDLEAKASGRPTAVRQRLLGFPTGRQSPPHWMPGQLQGPSPFLAIQFPASIAPPCSRMAFPVTHSLCLYDLKYFTLSRRQELRTIFARKRPSLLFPE